MELEGVGGAGRGSGPSTPVGGDALGRPQHLTHLGQGEGVGTQVPDGAALRERRLQGHVTVEGRFR